MPKERMQASDFPQEVLTLFDKYIHGAIERQARASRQPSQ